LVLAAALACALAGCAIVDATQARTCRMIIPALNPSASVIEIVRTAPLAAGDGVRIDYRVRASVGLLKGRFVECRFAGASHPPPEQGGLIGVATETGSLGDLRVHLLKRYWLEREGAATDPEPVAHASEVPSVPRTLAVGLQHVVLALPPIAIYALLAAAYSLVYGLVGRINFAFGELAAVGSYAAFPAFALAGSASALTVSLVVALLLALTAAFFHGVAAGRLVFAPLLRLDGQQLLIGTIALAIVLQEYLRLAQGSRSLWVQPLLATPHAIARSGDFVVTVTPMAMAAVGISLAAALALLGFMKSSRFGRAWRACADDPLSAALFGVDGRAVLLKTFALASLLAGLAGYVVTIYYGTFGFAGGIVLGLKSLLAAVAGGIGSVPGAFLGGILLGCVESLWTALFPIEFRDIAVLTLLVVLLVLRPGGIFGLHEALPPRT
jgi:branched-subunit amino acid ABC-type transport system permease component